MYKIKYFNNIYRYLVQELCGSRFLTSNHKSLYVQVTFGHRGLPREIQISSGMLRDVHVNKQNLTKHRYTSPQAKWACSL